MSCSSGQKCGKPKHIKLWYFNARGRGQFIRWLLAYVKADWEDIRFTREEWPAIKPTMPNGQVPVVEFECEDGKKYKLTQTGTILRSIAHLYGVVGKTPEEAVAGDECWEIVRDVTDEVFKLYFEEDKAKKDKLIAKLKTEVIPRNFGYLEKNAQTHGGKSLAGDEHCPCYAAVLLTCLLDYLKHLKILECEELKAKYPGLAAIGQKIYETPQIQAFIAKRPDTPF